MILAAGLGRRLAVVGPKPFLMYHGKSFIEITVENALSAQLKPLVIITNEIFYQPMVDLNFAAQILINPHPEQGMLSSILIGLTEIESWCSGFFLCPVDYPLVQQDTFNKLLFAHQSFPDYIIKPIFKDKSGHPIVIPRNLFQALKQAPMSQGARVVIRQYAHLTRTIRVDDPGISININTPTLYQRYCRQLIDC